MASDDIPSQEVQRLILEQIDLHESRHKWQLREALGMNDTRLSRELLALRRAGRIIAFGNRSMERRWKRA